MKYQVRGVEPQTSEYDHCYTWLVDRGEEEVEMSVNVFWEGKKARNGTYETAFLW